MVISLLNDRGSSLQQLFMRLPKQAAVSIYEPLIHKIIEQGDGFNERCGTTISLTLAVKVTCIYNKCQSIDVN